MCIALLVFADISIILAATKKIDQNPAELIKLAKNMEDFGYLKSAKHYYQLAYRNPTLKKEIRKKLDGILSTLDKKIALKMKHQKALPNLENLPHFNNTNNKKYKTTGITKAVNSNNSINPKEFPRSRINKKKWIFASIAIIGIALVINKKIKDDNKDVQTSTPNSITIGF